MSSLKFKKSDVNNYHTNNGSRKITKLSYSNVLRKHIPLKIETLSILNWLKTYELEQYYEFIFKKYLKSHWYDKNDRSDTIVRYKYDFIMKAIKTNVDLLFSFNSIDHFVDIIEPMMEIKIYNDALNGIVDNIDINIKLGK